jgi:PleD family two-component response regulator
MYGLAGTVAPEETKMRLLVVEDVRLMVGSIARSLRREGMAVDAAYDGSTAPDLAAQNEYDVTGLIAGVPIAAAVGFCNATSSAALAAAYPATCGPYVQSCSTTLGGDIP